MGKLAIKVLVSLLLLAGLLRYLDLGAVLERLRHVNYIWVAAACLCLMTG